MTIVSLSNEPNNCSGRYSATVGYPQWACHAQLTLSSYVARTVWCGYPHQKKIPLSQLKNLFLDRENKLFSIKTQAGGCCNKMIQQRLLYRRCSR